MGFLGKIGGALKGAVLGAAGGGGIGGALGGAMGGGKAGVGTGGVVGTIADKLLKRPAASKPTISGPGEMAGGAMSAAKNIMGGEASMSKTPDFAAKRPINRKLGSRRSVSGRR